MLIGRQDDMEVVGLAGSGDEAVQQFTSLRPDVTLMDLQLGRMTGVDAIIAIRRIDPDARIVVLTMFQGDEDVFRALEAGAATYLLKDAAFSDLVHAVRQVHEGRSPSMSPQVKAQLAWRATRPALTPARDRDSRADSARTQEPRDRRIVRHLRRDRADACEEHPAEARRARSHRGRERSPEPRHPASGLIGGTSRARRRIVRATRRLPRS